MNVVEYITERLGEPTHRMVGSPDGWVWWNGTTRIAVTQSAKGQPFTVELKRTRGALRVNMDAGTVDVQLVDAWVDIFID